MYSIYKRSILFFDYICAINHLGLKRIIAILFLFSFLIMSFSKNIVILNFYVNRDALAAKYCINKYKPGLHCNGHCFLIKQLKKEQQRETTDLGNQMNKLEVVSSQNYFPIIKAAQYELSLVQTTHGYYNCNYTKDITLLVFKPPRV